MIPIECHKLLVKLGTVMKDQKFTFFRKQASAKTQSSCSQVDC